MVKMSMDHQMRMEQRMKLAPRMIQAMEVLQLPLLALQEKIETELNSNPVLELSSNPDETAPLEEPAKEPAEDFDEKELVVREDSDNAEDFRRLDNTIDEFGDAGEWTRPSFRRSDPSDSDKKLEAMQNTAAAQQSLNDFLKEQWRMVETTDQVRAAGELIIDYIDEKGYLSVRLEQLYSKDKHSFNLEHLQQALKLVQSLEPAGVGARDLRESLLIQMEQFPEDMSFEIRLVKNHWDDLLENRMPQIAKKMDAAAEQISKAIERMSKLDTSPGLRVGPSLNHPINADVIVEADEQGRYSVRLTETYLPNLRVNMFYQKMSRNREIDENTRKFLQKNIRSAQWFMDAVEQRKQTLLKVASAIVEAQKEFFDKGKLYLKPLPMSAVAEKVGVHIATISRAVSGKYMQCPQGILPLRGFFSAGLENTTGQKHSYDAVRARIQQIADAEDKSNPLSDEQIQKELAQSGMGRIARRTVAKYRQILDIPTARLRKKY